jgi:hypothetical protein
MAQFPPGGEGRSELDTGTLPFSRLPLRRVFFFWNSLFLAWFQKSSAVLLKTAGSEIYGATNLR